MCKSDSNETQITLKQSRTGQRLAEPKGRLGTKGLLGDPSESCEVG